MNNGVLRLKCVVPPFLSLSNIAEGYGRQATGEYRHHLSMGRGSLLELETQVLLCRRLKYLEVADADALLTEIEEISKMLASLISKLV